MIFKTDFKKFLRFKHPYNIKRSKYVSYLIEDGVEYEYSLEVNRGIRKKNTLTDESFLYFSKTNIEFFYIEKNETYTFIYTNSSEPLTYTVYVIDSNTNTVLNSYRLRDLGDDVWFRWYDGDLYLFYLRAPNLKYYKMSDSFSEAHDCQLIDNEEIHFIGEMEDGSFGLMLKILNVKDTFNVDPDYRYVYLPENHLGFEERIAKV